jgi:hypothetical protein
MRPALLSAPAEALPSNPRRGLAGTVALHATMGAALVLATIAGSRLSPVSGREGTTAGGPLVVMVPPPASMPPPVLIVSGPALGAVDAMPPSAAFTTADGFSYDTSRIRLRREVLFPFLTGELPFLDALRAAAASERQRLHNPLGTGGRRARSSRPPLELSAAAREALVDGAWSRRDRWPSLAKMVELTGRYDGNEGQLPVVVREHVERNLLQPYFETSVPDPRFWVMLGLAADHLDVIQFVGRYAQQHPSSRTTTELLFLLDELADANRGAFELLIGMDLAGLGRTAASSPQDVQLARQLQRGYEAWTRERGLDDAKALDAHYDGVRLAILSTIVETSPNGYGAADARFLAGRLLWDRSDVAGAVRLWRSMALDERRSDERTTYAVVRAEIGRALAPDGSVDVVRIVGALGAERSRWLRESADRLARFGYTPQTF